MLALQQAMWSLSGSQSWTQHLNEESVLPPAGQQPESKRYEDSYALTQEFREWITCIGESPELFAESVMSVGQVSEKRHGHDLEEGSVEI